ncbi:beta-propeller domain-containing protein [Lysobacter sp. cf310]|uniref:beta-propeller domain-containing protein n=1 Tax=Lysobacter sp. cf310 TaxID=1761790 RepID=UPI0008E8575C|nr:beta-propeller domain-containing protein [Lysobacter sp. cf310]SFL19835.1 Beta propeller domain-containing protein [Lysobacter sp. cf310]
MSGIVKTALLSAALALGILATAPAAAAKPSLQPFEDEAAFQALLKKWKQEGARSRLRHPVMQAPPPAPMAANPPEVDSSGQSLSLDRIEVTGSRISASDLAPTGPDSITNVQTEGVDEGDIVKKAGDYLIVLRRGRLFTVRIGDDELRAVSTLPAHAPGVDMDDTWIDEMLISDRTVVVIGYSYERGGTEIGLFELDAQGGLHYRNTYQLRSGDYYSERNYASRLIGRTLIFYAPVPVDLDDPNAQLPALRHWRTAATPDDFKRILPATRIYRGLDRPDGDQEVSLHTVSICELGAAEMSCRATAVLGEDSRDFYVSEDAVYVWTASWEADSEHPKPSSVFRLPLDGGAPAALRTSGYPIDQMSFLQRDGHLNVLVGTSYDGQGMWRQGLKAGEVALLRVPLASFGDATARAPASAYRALPGINSEYASLYNRYIGDWLVYGEGENWADKRPIKHSGYALRYADSQAPLQAFGLPHYISRIEALGDDALLVGPNGSDLHFTSVRLDGKPAPASAFVYPDTYQADQRTHGFFYRPTGDGIGIAGLPVLREDPDDDEAPGQASVVYLRNRALHLSRMGQLDARTSPAVDDGCQVSCVDWYGNARPIFVGGRVFALLGYELVEGRVDADRIQERRRVDFGPGRAAAVSK